MSNGTRLNTVMFLASGAGPHPTVLLLHGFPGNEKNLDLAYVLRRAGWNVLFPHYRGSWGSGGNFSFSNAIEDTQAALNFLREPANVKKYHIDPTRIVLIGHSMGGLMAAYTAARDPGSTTVIELVRRLFDLSEDTDSDGHGDPHPDNGEKTVDRTKTGFEH